MDYGKKITGGKEYWDIDENAMIEHDVLEIVGEIAHDVSVDVKDIKTIKEMFNAVLGNISPDDFRRKLKEKMDAKPQPSVSTEPLSPVGNAPPTEELFKTPFTSKKAEASSPEALNTPTPQKDTPLRDVDRDTLELIILSGDVSTANEALGKIQTIMEKIAEKKKASGDKLGTFNRETRDEMDALMRETTRDDDYKYDTFRNALVSNRFNGRGLNNAYALKYTIMKYMKELLERKMPRKTVIPPRFQATP